MEMQNSNMQHTHVVAAVIKSYGYPVEIYDEVTSEDEYITTLYRIPHGQRNKSRTPRPIVLLAHGALCNSLDFVITGPKRGLGFVLSDLGYDVWMTNHRGTSISKRHTKFDPDTDNEYWRFSFHEMAVYDLPAVLNHIEHVTNCPTLIYIGISIGALLPYILLSEKPDYNKRFNLLIAVAPPAIVKVVRSVLCKLLLSSSYVILPVMKCFGYLEFPPKWYNLCMSFFKSCFGQSNNWVNAVLWYMKLINGKTSEQLDKEDVLSIVAHYPETSSITVLEHIRQFYETGKFIKFNHGPERNLEEYGTPTPPVYDLRKVVCPTVIISSTDDLVVYYKDVREQSNLISNCIAYHEIDTPPVGHLDFVYGRDISKIMYPIIIDHLQNFNRVE